MPNTSKSIRAEMEWYMMSASKDFETIIFKDLISFFYIYLE